MDTETYLVKSKSENVYDLLILIKAFEKLPFCRIVRSQSFISDPINNICSMKIWISVSPTADAIKWEKDLVMHVQKNKLVTSLRKELYASPDLIKSSNSKPAEKSIPRHRGKKWSQIAFLDRSPLAPLAMVEKIQSKRQRKTASVPYPKRKGKATDTNSHTHIGNSIAISDAVNVVDDGMTDIGDMATSKDVACDGLCKDIQCPTYGFVSQVETDGLKEGCPLSPFNAAERNYFQNLTPKDLATLV